QAKIMGMADETAVVADEHAAKHDVAGSFPEEVFTAMSQTPLYGLTVPEEFGGMGADPLETMLAIETLAQGDGSAALIATMHWGHTAGVGLNTEWPADLKKTFLNEVATNGALYNTAASEPAMGSPSRGGSYAT